MTSDLADAAVCHLTTVGRRSGVPRRIEIWFAADRVHDVIYLLAGGRERAGWVRNLSTEPRGEVEILGQRFVGTARVLAPSDPEDATARRRVYEKYRDAEDELEDWRDQALPVAIALRPV